MNDATSSDDEEKILWLLLYVAMLAFLMFISIEGCSIGKPNPESDAIKVAREEARTWVQLLTGTSWPSLEPLARGSCAWRAAAQTVHTLLSTATGLVFLWFLYQLILKQRRKFIMDLATLLAHKDGSLRAQVENLALQDVPEDKYATRLEEVNKAFEQADEAFRETLEVVLGKDEADRVLSAMRALEKTEI